MAERQHDQKRAVAAANAAAAVGEAEAERDRRKALAAADAEASVGEAEASRNRRQKVSLLEAEAVNVEAQASASVANFQATRKVAEEEARSKGQSASVQADQPRSGLLNRMRSGRLKKPGQGVNRHV